MSRIVAGRRLVTASASAFTLVLGLTLAAGPARAATAPEGVQSNGQSVLVGMSSDGRYVLFNSLGTNLIPGDAGSGNPYHCFRRDLRTGRTELVDVTPDGRAGNGSIAGFTHLSADGRYALFMSSATDLMAEPSERGGLYVRDLRRHTTERLAPVGTSGQPVSPIAAAGISAGGRYVVFHGYDPGVTPTSTESGRFVYVHDRWRHTTRALKAIAPDSAAPAWSASTDPSGRFVGWSLRQPAGGHWTATIQEIRTGTERPVAVTYDGTPAADDTYVDAITPGGVVLFHTFAANIVPGDTNGGADSFLRDTRTGTTTRVTVGDGASDATGGVGTALTPDGRYVVFWSHVPNLVPDDQDDTNDLFLRDTRAGTTTRITPPNTAGEPETTVMTSAISANGRFVVFQSSRSTLVPGDTNGVMDLFRKDLWTGRIIRVSVG